ncbi:MAG: DUF669 domain-containing protein [Verrucomicrobiaceae bacterium]|nr:MAG: DUF669 domain-containing protein [Verrucomicrobiaceae bacterium]
MQFKPKSADEIAMDGLLPEGKYPFTVVAADETTSKKSGAPMLKLKLLVYGEGNRQATVYDYLMESVADRLYKFCSLVGLEQAYDAGALEAYDCMGKEGWVHIKVEPAAGGFGPRNSVGYYCQEPKGTAPPAPRTQPPAKDLNDDEIPF